MVTTLPLYHYSRGSLAKVQATLSQCGQQSADLSIQDIEENTEIDATYGSIDMMTKM